MAREYLTTVQTQEQGRHNRATEALTNAQNKISSSQVSLGYSQLAETSRSNIEREKLTNQSNVYNYRTNAQRNQETERHNRAQEAQQATNLVVSGLGSIAKSIALML